MLFRSQLHRAAGGDGLARHRDAQGPHEGGVFHPQLLRQRHQRAMDGVLAPLGQPLQHGHGLLEHPHAGPRVIEQTIGQKLPKGFQRSEFLLEHGFIDGIVERPQLKETLSQILMLHVQGNKADGSESGLSAGSSLPRELRVYNDITAFFSRDPGLKKLFMEGKVWFPANFNILATMNTADENIFVLDNAFKRRFALEYVRISFDDLPREWSHPYDTFAGRRPLTAIFQGTPLEDFVSQLYYEGHLSRDWPTFARLVNKLIDMVNRQQLQEMAERSDTARRHLSRIPENKKLGPFFVSEADRSEERRVGKECGS